MHTMITATLVALGLALGATAAGAQPLDCDEQPDAPYCSGPSDPADSCEIGSACEVELDEAGCLVWPDGHTLCEHDPATDDDHQDADQARTSSADAGGPATGGVAGAAPAGRTDRTAATSSAPGPAAVAEELPRTGGSAAGLLALVGGALAAAGGAILRGAALRGRR